MASGALGLLPGALGLLPGAFGLLPGVLVLFLTVALSACAPQNAQVTNDKAVDAIMQAYVGDVPGASVLVVRDGKPLVRRRMAGQPRGKPRDASDELSPNLGDEAVHGGIDPAAFAEDATVARRPHPQVAAVVARDRRSVTIRHLLTHTGGLIDYEDIMADAGNEDR
jgi:CubicO group peptidase (beta-lactamase class C family)